MKHLIQYSSKVENLFFAFIRGGLSKENMIRELYLIETYHKGVEGDLITSEKGIWFKFSKDDTLATTIKDLDTELEYSNREYYLERMQNAISLEGNLQIYYS